LELERATTLDVSSMILIKVFESIVDVDWTIDILIDAEIDLLSWFMRRRKGGKRLNLQYKEDLHLFL
jgi:hypothetical protein